ncbi:MAG: ImmA/IrrE family metallo-endopeptidase [Bacteroidota bacterium]|nr:ImmA/IrrE family metallo-endopeptidase [Bacteroidota bacterium]
MDTSNIEKRAEQILEENNCTSLPINVKGLVVNMGIKLEKINFDDDVSGLFVIKKDKPYICYNANQSKNRIRFTIAHELGHYLLHSKTIPLFIDKQNKVLYRDSKSSTGEISMEIEANAFAAALLMPEKLIQNELDKMEVEEEDVIQYLADKFSVSPQAMSFRLSNLGYDFGIF